MTKYLVKKDLPFLTTKNSLHLYHAGAKVNASDIASESGLLLLVQHGFIEEVKEDSRWRAKIDGEYFYIDTLNRGGMRVSELKEDNDDYDRAFNKEGNYFKSKETADKVAETLELFFEWLHDVDTNKSQDPGYDIDGSMNRLSRLMDEARNAVLADDKQGSDE